MIARAETSNAQTPQAEKSTAQGMNVALIGPNDTHRQIVARALASSQGRKVHEFIDYPNQLRDPRTHPMDFAFRQWAAAAPADDFRFRVKGAGHLAFTDLIRMFRMRTPPAVYGTIPVAEIDGLIGDFSLGFLDRFVGGRDNGFPHVQQRRHPGAIRHVPAR